MNLVEMDSPSRAWDFLILLVYLTMIRKGPSFKSIGEHECLG